MKTLIKIKHGSHLYGTNTATSDLDFKGVHLPSAEKILLQKASKTVDKGTKIGSSEKNTKDDVDDQSYPLDKFLDMLIAGDTVATEILFAPEDAIVEQSEEWPLIKKTGISLLNRKCKGFVGYCQRQAAKYGIKGSRMAACKSAMEMFKEALDDYGPTASVSVIRGRLLEFVTNTDHSSLVELEGGNGKMIHFECVDRKTPFNANLRTAYDLYAKIYDNYGERARQAMVNENIDWKAVSHAVRVAYQAIELLTEGKITFPRPEATLLRSIKGGKEDYKHVSKMLEALVEKVQLASETSSLPETSSIECRDGCVVCYYSKQVLETFAMPIKD